MIKKKFNQKKYNAVKKKVFTGYGGTTKKAMDSAYASKYGKVPTSKK